MKIDDKILYWIYNSLVCENQGEYRQAKRLKGLVSQAYASFNNCPGISRENAELKAYGKFKEFEKFKNEYIRRSGKKVG
ncbi:hypothetical protein KAT51_07530 [bacterium]|nr:hypothetical protein [bacterium]